MAKGSSERAKTASEKAVRRSETFLRAWVALGARGAGVIGFPLLVFFGDAVSDEVAVEGFHDVSAEAFGFGPIAAGFEDGGNAVRGGHVGGAGFEFRGGTNV